MHQRLYLELILCEKTESYILNRPTCALVNKVTYEYKDSVYEDVIM